MAFTKALYYPWIDIKNEAWLKNALFYWDTIRTIVPESVRQPYNNKTTREFKDNGYLVPLKVNSNMREINSLEKDVFKYLNTQEAISVLTKKQPKTGYKIYKDKLPLRIGQFYLYPEKFSNEVRYTLRELFSVDKKKYYVDEKFAYFYMTLLSTRLAEEHNISLLTETNTYSDLANSVRLDNKINFPSYRDRNRDFDYYENNKLLNEGLLSSLLLERINLDPETAVKKIIKFKNSYKDELGRFRTRISELSCAVNFKGSIKAIRQQIEDLLTNEIYPSINDLKNALSSNRIRYMTSGFLQVSFLGVPKISFPAWLLGMSLAPYALFAGAGISLTTTIILYNKKKQSILNKNPYSYLFKLEKKFK